MEIYSLKKMQNCFKKELRIVSLAIMAVMFCILQNPAIAASQ